MAALEGTGSDSLTKGPIVVMSDIHANLEALQAVLERTAGMQIYCLGDFVDYGANPNEVIELIAKSGASSVLGNHDRAALDGDTGLFNAKAALSSSWTRRALSPSSLSFLSDLKETMRTRLGGSDAFFTHGSPDDHLWEYVDPATHHLLFGHYLARERAEIVGLGHTHIPYVWKEEKGVVFNPGSVGQPRDADWRASYAVVRVEDGQVEVEVKRREYDCKKAAQKIRAAGLPASFADRLLPRGGNG
jgi:putative phosphoesterase